MLAPAARTLLAALRGGDPGGLANALEIAEEACRAPALDAERRELLEAIVGALRSGARERAFERLLAHLARGLTFSADTLMFQV